MTATLNIIEQLAANNPSDSQASARECDDRNGRNFETDSNAPKRKSPDPRSGPLILVISQVYVPDPASVGQHMADAAEELAGRGHRVVVLTSARGYEDPTVRYARRELRSGVEVVRLGFSSFGKRSIFHRLLGQLLFVAQVITRGLVARRLASVLVSTSPPMAGFAAVVISFLRRVPFTYWLMDMNPDQAIALGKVSPRSPLVYAMRWLNRRIFSQAANVVVLDRFMAERVRQQYRVGGSMHILPPWPHGEPTAEVPASANPFLLEHNPEGRFVVMYSGNHSLASPVTTLLDAALALKDDPQYLFMFIGGGLGKREVDDAIAQHQPSNILSLPYQPLDQLKYSLPAADLHVVTLGNDMVGIIHPCKIYGAMGVGRPILMIGPRPSHAADIIDEHQIGWQVEQGDSDSVVAAIRQAAESQNSVRSEISERARTAIVEHYSKSRLCGAFCDVAGAAVRHSQVAAQAATS